MKIQRQQHGKRGAFFIEENGEWVAEMTYSREGTRKIVIDHTEVDDSLKGKGIGKHLVAAAVQYARKNNLLIKPVCPFVKKVLEKGEEYEDVLSTS
ncbi:MAG TPA: GNAT family N-acetyltransferase [Pyrinomonadaceae bacterium]|nr:GNAT family N-acetyltransferase [Pyrinomonadaceae bacterium]